MNTDAQRARNARKRAKLRAKRRSGAVRRFKIDVYSFDRELDFESCSPGLLRRATQKRELLYVRGFSRKLRVYNLHHIDVEWIVSGLHDVSSSFICALTSSLNQGKNLCQQHLTLRLLVESGGCSRRFKWHVEDVEAVVADVVAAVVS